MVDGDLNKVGCYVVVKKTPAIAGVGYLTYLCLVDFKGYRVDLEWIHSILQH